MIVTATGLHLWLTRRPRSPELVVELALLYLFVFLVGLGGLVGALGHTFRAREVAVGIGWQPGSPFQFEVAMANLAFGVLGILCIWQRGGFWTATAIGYAIFLVGCASGHLREMLVAGNYAPLNVGPVLWVYDLAIPLLILGLLWVRHRLKAKPMSQAKIQGKSAP